MQKKITVIRNLEIIERELNSAASGVAALAVKKDSFVQFASNFVYHDKNIFLFLSGTDLLRSVKYDVQVKFSIFKNIPPEQLSKEKDLIYRLFSITVTGELREVEEKKMINDITQSYIQKYSGKLIYGTKDPDSFGKLVFIDSNELIAYEETGS
jgi:hypothetical protein